MSLSFLLLYLSFPIITFDVPFFILDSCLTQLWYQRATYWCLRSPHAEGSAAEAEAMAPSLGGFGPGGRSTAPEASTLQCYLLISLLWRLRGGPLIQGGAMDLGGKRQGSSLSQWRRCMDPPRRSVGRDGRWEPKIHPKGGEEWSCCVPRTRHLRMGRKGDIYLCQVCSWCPSASSCPLSTAQWCGPGLCEPRPAQPAGCTVSSACRGCGRGRDERGSSILCLLGVSVGFSPDCHPERLLPLGRGSSFLQEQRDSVCCFANTCRIVCTGLSQITRPALRGRDID